MNTKICNKCNEEKPISEFYFRKDRQQYYATCKPCLYNPQYQHQYRKTHKQEIKIYQQSQYKNNKEQILQQTRTYAKNHPEYYKDYRIKWYQENKEAHQNCMKEWYENNKQQIFEKQKLRRKNDPNFKMLCNLRRRLSHALKDNKKIFRTVELLGCTVEELKKYLELKFQPDMTWENYGKGGWHIDHINPCFIFDLTDPIEQKQCFHYSNLQPLWAKENQSKGKKIHPILLNN